MCGICGYAPDDPNASVDRETLARMRDILTHRGPDSQGELLAPGVGLGIRRLAIIDLETGDQPIFNEDRTIAVVCNGEIYNAPELRNRLEQKGHRFRSRSDVEVLVHLYEDLGCDLVHHLRGMFAIALWDSRKRQLLLVRDRFGIKPLHVARTPDGLLFGSEVKAILASGRLPRAIEPAALRDLFDFGWVVTPRTLAAGVRRVPPGSCVSCRHGAMREWRYWEPSFPERGGFPVRREAEWAEMLRTKLTETVGIHLRSDVPVGVWLSPGLDSSAIAAVTSRATSGPVAAFSVGFQDPNCDELSRAATLADFPEFRLSSTKVLCRDGDLALLPRVVWHVEDVAAFGIEIPCMLLAQATAQHVRVVLTGEGADELFGGYSWFHGDKLLRPLAWLPLPLRRLVTLGRLGRRLRPGAVRHILAPPGMNLKRYRAVMSWSDDSSAHELILPELRGAAAGVECAFELPEAFSRWHPFSQLQYFEMRLRLPDFITRELDRTTMAYSVEARVPFLDHELAELAATIPPPLKMKWLREKHILRRAMASVLPEEIATRRKRGLSAPVPRWFRQPLPEFARELLAPDALRETGLFEPTTVTRLLADHRGGAGHHGHQLHVVLAVQLWYRQFVLGRDDHLVMGPGATPTTCT